MSGRTIISVLVWIMVITSCNLPYHANRKPSVSVGDLKNGSGSLINKGTFFGTIDVTMGSDTLFWLVYNVSSSLDNDSVFVALGNNNSWKDMLTIYAENNSVKIFNPQIWMDPDGKVWIFWTIQKKHFAGKNEIWALTDDLATDDLIRSKPFFISDGTLIGKPVLLPNGKFMLPVCRDNYVLTIASFDHGKTWHDEGSVELPDDRVSVCSIIECSNGSLWMLLQTSKRIWESRSANQGLNWSELVVSNITLTGNPFFVQKLNSGNILLVKQAEALEAYISEDDGQTWLGKLILDENVQISHVTGHQIQDLFFPCCGEISIVYGIQQGIRNEIRMVKFTEDEVMAGRKQHYSLPLR